MKLNFKELFQYCLGGMIVIGFFTLIVVLIYKGIPPDNKDTFTLLIGALIGSFTSIVGYFFGSSLGSSKKTDMIKTDK